MHYLEKRVPCMLTSSSSRLDSIVKMPHQQPEFGTIKTSYQTNCLHTPSSPSIISPPVSLPVEGEWNSHIELSIQTSASYISSCKQKNLGGRVGELNHFLKLQKIRNSDYREKNQVTLYRSASYRNKCLVIHSFAALHSLLYLQSCFR